MRETNIKEILINSIVNDLQGIRTVGIPFSGSLDSSLVTYIVKNFTETKPILYTIGLPGCYDFKQADISSKLLDLKHNQIHIQEKKICEYLAEYKNITNDNNKVSISFSLPFFILLKHINEKTIITAHGADTLFGGFHKYLATDANQLKNHISECYQDFISKLETREYKLAQYLNKSLIMPFTNQKLAQSVLNQAPEFFIYKGIRKYGLRKLAEDIGLPKEISQLPKKAFQYSSGIIKPLKRLFRKELT